MSKKKKIEEGLNRLFSSSQQKKGGSSPSEEPNVTDSFSDKTSNPDKPENQTESKILSVSDAATGEVQPVGENLPKQPIADTLPSVEQETASINLPAKTQTVEQKAEGTGELSVHPDLGNKPPQLQANGPSTPVTSSETPDVATKQFEDEQVVIFSLSNQLFGINISIVESIIKMQTITELPRAKDFMLGVTNLRGRVVPVFNLSTQLNLPQTEASNTNRIVIVNISGYDAGILVDEVKSVTRIPGKDISVPTDMLSIDNTYVRAIARIDHSLLILLELKEVFTFQFGNVK